MPFAIFVFAAATIAIGTLSFAFSGFLAEGAGDLGVTVGTAGLLVPASAITVSVASPFAAAWVSAVERNGIIFAGLLVLSTRHALGAVVSNIQSLRALRVFGVPVAAFEGSLATASVTPLEPAKPASLWMIGHRHSDALGRRPRHQLEQGQESGMRHFPYARPFLAGMASLILAGCDADDRPRSAAANAATVPQAIKVLTVHLVPFEQSWRFAGVVKPRYESDLSFRVGGKIVERLVGIGDAVAPGQTLARLDRADYDLAAQSQQAELDAALTSLQDAERASERYRTLLKDGFVSKAAFDQRVTAQSEARARVERARRTVGLAGNQLNYTELKADHAGVVSAMPIEIGQVVAAGQLVVRLSRRDALDVQVALPELAVATARSARAGVELWGGGQPIAARLRELAPEADPVSRTYQARFALESSDDAITIGRSATVQLIEGKEKTVARLPLSAVMSDGHGATVWLVDRSGTTVRRAAVEIQALTQDQVIISRGLAESDRVVTLGVHMLDEARPVQIIELQAQTP